MSYIAQNEGTLDVMKMKLARHSGNIKAPKASPPCCAASQAPELWRSARGQGRVKIDYSVCLACLSAS
jgi:hypothetical protein